MQAGFCKEARGDCTGALSLYATLISESSLSPGASAVIFRTSVLLSYVGRLDEVRMKIGVPLNAEYITLTSFTPHFIRIPLVWYHCFTSHFLRNLMIMYYMGCQIKASGESYVRPRLLCRGYCFIRPSKIYP